MPHRIISCVREFMWAFEQTEHKHPQLLSVEKRKLRMKMLEDEYHEYRYAERAGDIVKTAEALAEMLYVIGGTALEYGLPLDKIFLEIHRSNMTKLGDDKMPILREDGKIMKGPHYVKPDIATIICAAKYPDSEEDL